MHFIWISEIYSSYSTQTTEQLAPYRVIVCHLPKSASGSLKENKVIDYRQSCWKGAANALSSCKIQFHYDRSCFDVSSTASLTVKRTNNKEQTINDSYIVCEKLTIHLKAKQPCSCCEYMGSGRLRLRKCFGDRRLKCISSCIPGTFSINAIDAVADCDWPTWTQAPPITMLSMTAPPTEPALGDESKWFHNLRVLSSPIFPIIAPRLDTSILVICGTFVHEQSLNRKQQREY